MFSKSCKYAIRAVLYLALNSDENNKISVEEISNKIDVPRHFLAKTLQILTRVKLVSSIKGPNGGFYLNEKNKRSNLYSVIDKIDGPESLNACLIGINKCSSTNPCPYHHLVVDMRNKLLDVLKKETIAETALRVKQNNYKIESI